MPDNEDKGAAGEAEVLAADEDRLAEMSDEQLNKTLEDLEEKHAQDGEDGDESGDEKQGETGASDESKEGDGDGEGDQGEGAGGEGGSGEEKPGDQEDGGDAGDKWEARFKAQQDQIDALQTDNRKLQLRADRQGNELGEYRRLKEKVERLRMTDEEFDTMFKEDPRGAMRREKELADAEKGLDELETGSAKTTAQSALETAVPDLKNLVPEIAKMLEEDGASPSVVADFQQDPSQFKPSQVLPYARAARQQLRLEALESGGGKGRQKESDTDDSGGSQGRGGGSGGGTGESDADKIEKAARSKKRLSGSSGQGSLAADASADDYTDEQLAAMDEKSLKGLLAKERKKEAKATR